MYRKHADKEHTENVETVDHTKYQATLQQQRKKSGDNAESPLIDRGELLCEASKVHTTSKDVSVEFKLNERDEHGEPIPYVSPHNLHHNLIPNGTSDC